MSSNARTKALVIVVVALALLWFIGDRYGMRSKDRTYREVVLTLDTAEVNVIMIEPGGTLRPDVRVVREGGLWRLYCKTDTLRVDNKYVLDVLVPLADMRVKRQVGTMDLVKDRYDLNDTLADADIRDKLLAQGAEAVGGTPDRLGQVVALEIPKWQKLARDANIKPD